MVGDSTAGSEGHWAEFVFVGFRLRLRVTTEVVIHKRIFGLLAILAPD